MALPARKLRRDEREERVDLVSLWGAEQSLLVEEDEDFARYVKLVVPRLAWDSEAYIGCVLVERERSVDELEPDNDETGFVDDPRIGQWIRRSGVDPLRALAASYIAASNDEPEPVGLSDGARINACAISYLPKDRVKWASLDLDHGTEHAAKVLAAIRADVGDDAILVHSGSGKKGRFRVLFRLEPSCEVRALHEHFSQWLAPHGFVYGEDYEAFPSQKHGRAMFGRNGCDWYSLDLATFKREKPATLLDAFFGQKPIYLRALANGEKDKVWVARKRNTTSSAPKSAPKQRLPKNEVNAKTLDRLERAMSGKTVIEHESLSGQTGATSRAPKRKATSEAKPSAPKKRLPRRSVEGRNPPTPQNVRDLLENGISGPRQRRDALYEIVKYCRYRMSEEAAIQLIWDMFDAGKFNASKDANTPSKREQQKRQIPKLVRRVYSTHEPLGRPEPVPLTQGEYARTREYAEHAALASGEPAKTCLSYLMWMLSLMKAGQIAGIPHVRIHNSEMRQAGGAKYAVIRDACEGLFVIAEKHRSWKSLHKSGLSEQRAKEYARARSYKTTFRFEL